MRKVAVAAAFLGAMALAAADSGGGVRWTAPAGWKAEAARPMRLATYSPPGGGECGVYYFGQGQGGSVEANLNRWIGQFTGPDGKPARAAAKIKHRTVNGLNVTTVDVAGQYTGMGGPSIQSSAPVNGYRLLGAIVEGPQGAVFFKFTGPAKAVAANERAFEEMIQSLRPQP
jgi:hypothetical protein